MKLINKKVNSVFITSLIALQIISTIPAFGQTIQANRVSGDDRYKTAAAISQKGWPNGSKVAIIARGDDFADSLCAVPLASISNAPILLTQPAQLNVDTLNELKRLKVENVIIAGGNSAVSLNVENSLRTNEIVSIERIWGEDRYETSVKIAERLGTSSKIALATGVDFPDALSISPIAARLGMPILLTYKNGLPDKTSEYIKHRGISKTYIIGQTAVIDDSVKNAVPGAIRLGGNDRYETNIDIMQEFAGQLDFSKIFVAVGDGPNKDEFADALSGAVLAAQTSSPLCLVYSSVPEVLLDLLKLKMSSSNEVIALGGLNTVSSSVLNEILGVPLLVEINSMTDKKILRQKIEANAQTLGVDVSPNSAYDRFDEGRKLIIAFDIINNRPQDGYKTIEQIKRVFDRLVITRTVTQEQLDIVNNAAATNDVNNLSKLGYSFITIVREDLEDASKVYQKLTGEDINFLLIGLEQAESAFKDPETTDNDRMQVYNAVVGHHFASYGELLNTIDKSLTF